MRQERTRRALAPAHPGAVTGACRALGRAAALWLLACATPMGAAVAAPSASAAELAREGFQVAWGGYAAITTCRGPRDSYPIGPYLFICAEGVAAYPYHFGTVFLVARVAQVDGRDVVTTYLCLEGDKKDDTCLRGTVLRR